MTQEELDKFCDYVWIVRDMNDKAKKAWGEHVEAMFLFAPVIYFLIGVAREPDEVGNIKRLVTERLNFLQKKFGQAWEFDTIDNLFGINTRFEDILQGTKPFIYITDKVTFENWKGADWRNALFLLNRSWVTYFFDC